MLDDLEQGVDRTDSKLQGSLKKLKKFIRDTEGALLVCFRNHWLMTVPCRDQIRVVYWYSYRDLMYIATHGNFNLTNLILIHFSLVNAGVRVPLIVR
jgi:hypothetical protein